MTSDFPCRICCHDWPFPWRKTRHPGIDSKQTVVTVSVMYTSTKSRTFGCAITMSAPVGDWRCIEQVQYLKQQHCFITFRKYTNLQPAHIFYHFTKTTIRVCFTAAVPLVSPVTFIKSRGRYSSLNLFHWRVFFYCFHKCHDYSRSLHRYASCGR